MQQQERDFVYLIFLFNLVTKLTHYKYKEAKNLEFEI
jgi:hypothetical protein